MKTKKILSFILSLVVLSGCGSEEIEKKEVAEEKPAIKKNDFKFKSYKRIAPLSNLERIQLEKRSEVQDKGRNLLKSFDKNKSQINPSSQE